MDEEVNGIDERAGIVQAIKDHGSKLFRFIRKKVRIYEDAEDISQDVWSRFSEVSSVKAIHQTSGWLFAAARNRITDTYRKKHPELLDDYMPADEEGNLHLKDIQVSDPEIEYLKNLFWEELFEALDELPANQQCVFVKNELEGKTLQQIADETGENIKTIISRKHYAMQHLRKALQHLYNDLMKD